MIVASQVVYLNGVFVPIEEAYVSVLDRGFLFGDGVYEVIPVYGSHLLRLTKHLQRLQNSLDGIRLQNPLSMAEWRDMLQHLVSRNEGVDQSVYLQVTRGVAPKRDHRFPDEVIPTVFAMSNPLSPVPRDALHAGTTAITLDDIRWRVCNVKATALLANTLLRQQASDRDAGEAILLRDGLVTEGSASNVFIVTGGMLVTPRTSPLLLPGITRDLVLELARIHNIANTERDISEQELRQADEIWITNSTREIVPVLELDGQPVGNGQPGPLWQKMIDIYQDYKQQLRDGKVD